MMHSRPRSFLAVIGIVGVVCAWFGCFHALADPAITENAMVALPGLKKELTVELGRRVSMEFVLIPPGSFLMGSETGEANEKPVHKVTITRPFYLGKYEVTQAQWQTLMGDNPSYVKGTNNPVEMVSWNECQEFLAKLKRKVKGLKPCLPTEAQWEYACRAGSTGDFCCAEAETNVAEYSWCSLNATGTPHPVGQKKPNAWGLYDMHGNVWEWCADLYDAEYYASSAQQDPRGPDSSKFRVVRGGSWICVPYRCRAPFRLKFAPFDRFSRRGLRVCLDVPYPLSRVPGNRSPRRRRLRVCLDVP